MENGINKLTETQRAVLRFAVRMHKTNGLIKTLDQTAEYLKVTRVEATSLLAETERELKKEI